MPITDYHAKYFAYELTKRSASNSLQKLATSLLDAQVDLNPHQIDAALFSFNSPLSKGAILADEVGLGKTIEAGIVISQKWAAKKRRILIIVPSNLRKQWNQELSDKFFIPSIILETPSFKEEIKNSNLNPFEQDKIVICSYHFARSKDVYIKQVDWDLVVIDEAHRLRNVYKPTNKIANAIKAALANYPKLLLTATPLQNSLLELYGLTSVIDDYVFGDFKSFKSQFARLTGGDDFTDLKERLSHICKRTLRRQVLEYISYTNRIAITQEFYPLSDEQKLYDLVSEYLQRDALYALPASQRHLMTLILRKLLASSTFAISSTLEALANRLDGLIKSQNEVLSLDDKIAENLEVFDELKEEWVDSEEETETEKTDAQEQKRYSQEDIGQMKKEMADLIEFHKLAKSIAKNSKGEVLITALKKGFIETEKLGGNKKAIIFTESTRTQSYLYKILDGTEYKDKIILFNGSNNDQKSKEVYARWLKKHEGTDRITGSKTADKRAAITEYFKEEAVLMIATEAAAEGINLQFCSLVVNYDLPWNPQRIEQRIGRCHRYGQKHDVVVVNFLNKSNAADQRVYQLLSEKFKLFSGVFGASDEVLGSIESGVDFEKRIADIYQRCRTQEEIQASFDQLQKELEEQIEDRISLTRQKLLENFDEEVHEKLRISLQASKECLSKYENWLWEITRLHLAEYANFDSTDHAFTLRKNPFPNETIHPGPYRLGKNVEEANIYRVGHPLAQRIINHYKNIQLSGKGLKFNYSNAPVKISQLETLVGESGVLLAVSLSVTSFEAEDFVILTGIRDNGKELEEEQCRRLFSLPAEPFSIDESKIMDARKDLTSRCKRMSKQILEDIGAKNANYFELELDKLDKWSEDRRNSLKINLKELDEEIKELKKQSRLAPNLPEKLKLEKERKQLETKRNDAWKEYDMASKEIEVQKDGLIDQVEKKLNKMADENELFFIRWSIV